MGNAAANNQSNQQYYGQSIGENGILNDQERRHKDKQNKAGQSAQSTTMVEDQFNKKQIEFKGGKVHQVITDQPINSNRIYANRYQGALGIWYFLIDSTLHFENFLAIILLGMIIYSSEYNQIDMQFAIVALLVNVVLMCVRNITLETRVRKINGKINNKLIEVLMITRKARKFMPLTWAEIKPGHIIRITSG